MPTSAFRQFWTCRGHDRPRPCGDGALSRARAVVDVSALAPDDIASPHVDDYCWHPDGWECAAEGSVRDAAATTRGKAAADFAEYDIRDVRVWKRYVERFTVRECWEWYATASLGEPNAVMPDGWQPHEESPVWRFVPRDYPGAVPVWICGLVGDKPPEKP